MIRKLFQTSDGLVPLVLRLVLGTVMFAHGAQKVLGWFGGYGFGGTYDAFAQQGMPAVVILLVFAAEFLGSLGLITGLLTRVSAVGIALVMLGAIFMVHLPNGFFMNWYGAQAGEGFEYHILALGLAAGLAIAGGGRLSLDGLIASKLT